MIHRLLPPGGSRQAHCFLGLATGLEGARADAGKDVWKEGIMGNWAHTGQRQGPGRFESPTAGGVEGAGGMRVALAFGFPAVLEPGFRRLLPPEHVSFPFCYLLCRAFCDSPCSEKGDGQTALLCGRRRAMYRPKEGEVASDQADVGSRGLGESGGVYPSQKLWELKVTCEDDW